MREKLINILNKSFVRNVTVLASGTAAAQAISMLSSPFITRLYGPDAFGIMGAFMAIVQIFAPVAALTYPTAIVLPKKNIEAKKIIEVSLFVTLTIAILLTLVIFLYNEEITEILQISEVSSFLYLIPLIVFFSGIIQVSEQWLTRTKQFSINAKVTFLQSLIINSSKIGIGIVNPVATVLVFLTASADCLKVILVLIFLNRSKNKSIENLNIKLSKQNNINLSIKELAKKYMDFPLFRAPQVLINSLSQRTPILILTAFFGPTAAGFYTLGNTVLQKPIQLIGNSVGDVFYPRISEAANNNEDIAHLIKKTTLVLAIVGLIPFGIIILFGPWIFSVIFGSEWLVAGKYAQWIGLFLYFEFINRPSVRALPVLGAQFFHLKFTVIILIIRVSALSVGYYLFSSDLVAIALFGISSAILNLTLFISVLKRSNSDMRR